MTSRTCFLAVWLGIVSATALGAFPQRVFAPYLYLGSSDRLKAEVCLEQTGQRFFILAFVVRGSDGQTGWDGRGSFDKAPYQDQIEILRKAGGDVIISFGGYEGAELALHYPDVQELTQRYQAVVDRYQAQWLDFDIEGRVLENTEANQRRNAAIALLQQKNPNLRISYTVAVGARGMPRPVLAMIEDAVRQKVKIHCLNLMTMSYGPETSKGKKMGELAIASAKAAYGQAQKLDGSIQIGITPMIGQNDVKSEFFMQEDARLVLDFAQETPWVRLLAFWSVNRDAGKEDSATKNDNFRSGIKQARWEFTRIFQPFTSAATRPAQPER